MDRHALFPYLALGLGGLSGFGGGAPFERNNVAVTGLVGVEVPLSDATGLGFELDGDLELSDDNDIGNYTALLVRARLGQMVSPRTRLWGAVDLGRAGYLDGSLAGGFALGSTLMFVPKLGVDLSASLTFLGDADQVKENGARYHYDGGAVLLIAAKLMFEFHKTR